MAVGCLDKHAAAEGRHLAAVDGRCRGSAGVLSCGNREHLCCNLSCQASQNHSGRRGSKGVPDVGVKMLGDVRCSVA